MQLYVPLILSSSGESRVFFTATLPLPPSINASHTVNRRGVIVLSNALNAFQQEAAYTLPGSSRTDASILSLLQRSRIKFPLAIHFDFYFATRWANDTDNRIKYAQDACFRFLGLNDNLVDFVSARRCVDAEKPRCEVEISCFVRGSDV